MELLTPIHFRNERFLVTGGAGFIGSQITKCLVMLGARVTVVDNFSSASSTTLPGEATIFRINLPDPRFFDILGQGRFTGLFHLAGPAYVPPSIEDPISDLRNSTEVTLHVLEAIRNYSPTTRLIYTSSAAVYGNPEELPISEDAPAVPVSPYGVSKLAAENYVSLYAQIHHLQAASLRLFSVFGPGQRKQVVFDLIQKLIINSRSLEVYGTGTEMRDFVYVEDVVTAALLVLTRGDLQGEVYNVASGVGITIDNTVQTIASLLGVMPDVHYTGQVRQGDALRWVADISSIVKLGFASNSSFSTGVQKTIYWYITNLPHHQQPIVQAQPREAY